MTNGQIEKLQELARCWCLRRFDVLCIEDWLDSKQTPMDKIQEAWLRRLWHQYQPQIVAMQRNRKVTE